MTLRFAPKARRAVSMTLAIMSFKRRFSEERLREKIASLQSNRPGLSEVETMSRTTELANAPAYRRAVRSSLFLAWELIPQLWTIQRRLNRRPSDADALYNWKAR